MKLQAGYAPRKGDDTTLEQRIPIPKHGFGPRRGEDHPLGEFTPPGKFGRMFPELLPLTPPLAALDELGAAMVDDAGNASADNAAVPAGFTYFGQFIDH